MKKLNKGLDMKTRYEFRKKALKLACEEGFYNAVKCLGIYEGFEVYTPYNTAWKDNPPKIGLPQLILVNEKEAKWCVTTNPFAIMYASKKLPSVVFEYDCMSWFGNSYNIKLLADGTLIKYEYGYSKLGPDDRMRDDCEKVILKNLELVTEIKKLYEAHNKELKNLPRELSNYHILDGANETVRIGRMKFHGSNMFAEDMAIYADKYKNKEIPDEDYFVMILYEFQKIFAEIKAVINKYCPDRNIWTGFNCEEEEK